jgi:hypothetical protein
MALRVIRRATARDHKKLHEAMVEAQLQLHPSGLIGLPDETPPTIAQQLAAIEGTLLDAFGEGGGIYCLVYPATGRKRTYLCYWTGPGMHVDWAGN